MQENSVQALDQLFLDLGRSLLQQADQAGAIGQFTLSQLRCLGLLHEKGGRSMQEMSIALGLKPPATSHLLQRLVRRGLVQRSSDPDDRRIVRVFLTDEATQIMAARYDRRSRFIQKVYCSIPEDQRHAVLQNFGLLVRVTREQSGVSTNR